MPKVISSTELQRQTRETIDYARMERDPVIIETYGRPMAVILSFDEYQEYQNYLDKRRERFERVREAADANAAYNALSEAEALRLVEEVREEIRSETEN